jgi:hypothetical protein
MRIFGVGAATLAATLALAASAQAEIGTWAGTVTGTTGQIALDVKINRQSALTKVKQIRVKDVPSQCPVEGTANVAHTFPANLKIQGDGSFSGAYSQPTYGNQSTFAGQFNRNGHKIKGTIQINFHYPAEGGVPEEDCDTGPLPYKVKYNAPDGTQTRPNWR